MRVSHYFLSTLKEAPAEAETISHRLMLRAGLIKRLAAGIYTWMPLGVRILHKVEAIVREEMNRAGAIELLMPVVQPAELWQESGRWAKYGPELLRLKDRHERDFVIQPTSEEVITDIARKELKSYKQLPINFYHIQTKFRDEVRPRFGVMRSREFIMKDAYSFDADKESLKRSYQIMYDAYTRIFTRMGLTFRAVLADTGNIGGFASHEFQVLAESGEDAIAYCPTSDYAANVELAEGLPPAQKRSPPAEPMQKVPTPGEATCEEVAALLGLPLSRTGKCLWIRAPDLVSDIRNVVKGDPSPDGKGLLDIMRGIEVGHVFALGNVYSAALGATYLDADGQSQVMEMGCYGIGITRVVAAAIEQNNDAKGIIWPQALAPFSVAIAPIGYDRSDAVRQIADRLHDECAAAGIEVLLDDRGERPGVMFADLELIGIPHRITIGDRGLKDSSVEYQGRRDGAATPVPLAEITNW